ncbi:cytochrome P450 2D17-like [Orycteropus afer afer]|uniref:Cytochrome P450 2D17-like n=1 Tax=Orycteropus afer afer TaxID=1230840 RepID=A0AC54Z2K5_ORYAF|nr:cytochrome P450 2D17-like [Orycteropus afer afer]
MTKEGPRGPRVAAQVLNAVPALLRIPWLASKVFSGQRGFLALMDVMIAQHKDTRDPAQPARDLTDAFLDEVDKAKGNPESSFTEENLRLVVGDLFSAGMVTTSTTLAWGLLLMLLHPDVQRRVQEEIDEVIGQVRPPEMGDQARMPFTTAVVHEVQRFGDCRHWSTAGWLQAEGKGQFLSLYNMGRGRLDKPSGCEGPGLGLGTWLGLRVSGVPAVREALVLRGEDTSDRPPMPVYQHLGYGPSAQGLVLASYGHAWREQRRFSVSTLRNFGVGKKSLEQWVTEEAACLCAAFAAQAGESWRRVQEEIDEVIGQVRPPEMGDQAHMPFTTAVVHEVQRFGDIVPLGVPHMTSRDTEVQGFLIPKVLNAFPVLLRIPGLASKVLSGPKEFMALIHEMIAEHRETRDAAQPPRDLTDAFLDEVEKAKGNPESSFTEENLLLVVADLFFVGLVTTSTTLVWALLLMLLHPDVHRRVQEEIDEVIGQVRPPEMEDQALMPFTTAVIHKVQRFGDVVPLGVPHMTSRDTEVQGFLIPKGTTLIANLSSVLKDEAVWEQPFRFHPEHFLDAQGHFVKPEAFMPFSAGRRLCLGEPLAHMELFLFFTCLLQRFSFSVPAGQPRPSAHGVCGLVVSPPPYQLCAVPR